MGRRLSHFKRSDLQRAPIEAATLEKVEARSQSRGRWNQSAEGAPVLRLPQSHFAPVISRKQIEILHNKHHGEESQITLAACLLAWIITGHWKTAELDVLHVESFVKSSSHLNSTHLD